MQLKIRPRGTNTIIVIIVVTTYTNTNTNTNTKDVVNSNKIQFSDRPNVVHAEFDCEFNVKKSRYY